MKTVMSIVLRALLLALLFASGACRGHRGSDTGRQEAEHDHEAEAVITLAPAAAGDIHTAAAALRVFERRVAAPGVLEFNARRLAHLTARVAGRIERVLAVSGDRVRAGQVLAEAYSPEFMSLQAEFLQAGERARRSASDPRDAAAARSLLESARRRLLLVGAAGSEIDDIAATGLARPLLPVRAPFAGTVYESGIVAGDHVAPGASLFRLADPTVLWASLQIREEDMAALAAGAGVELRAQAYPGETFRGRLLLIGDVLDEQLRTVPGRVEVPNPSGKLKAGMFVEGLLASADKQPALAVPEDAVQDDEGRQIVFVRSGERGFIRREVVTGRRSAGQVEVVSGLRAGEIVATSGSFLLKSEMRKGSLEDEHGHS